jgi:integrase
VEYGITVPDVFKQKNFKFGLPKKIEARPLPLTEKEFIKLYVSTPKIDADTRLKKTRDRFLIQCTTGFRNSDLFNVKPGLIINKKDRILEYSPVKTNDYKTNNKIMLPLNAYAWDILKEYNFDTSGLEISNQKYNDAIKELFRELGVNRKLDIRDYVNSNDYSDFEKRFDIDLEACGYMVEKWMLMSSHNGRDTFITRCIEQGIDIETIMNFTGQTKYEMMRKYISTSTEYKLKMAKKFDNSYAHHIEMKQGRDVLSLDPEFSKLLEGDEED